MSADFLVKLLFSVGLTLAHGQKHHRSIRSFGFSKSMIWPDGEIPYTLDATYSDAYKLEIRAAMDIWERHTCIRFVPMTESWRPYNEIVNDGKHCSATVGLSSRKTNLREKRCGFQAILHELGHVMGFYHEHERPDRLDPDSPLPNSPGWTGYRINWSKEDIISGTYGTYYTPQLLGPYDPLSIMHYTLMGMESKMKYVWGRWGKRIAIYRSKDPCLQQFIGQTTQPSYLDTKGVNEAYNCNATCNETVFTRCREKSLAGASRGDECYVGGNCECVCESMFDNPCRRAPGDPPKIIPCKNPYWYGWQCKNGRCINKRWLCDQYADCDDGEDETCRGQYFCPTCPKDEFSSCDLGPNNVSLGTTWRDGVMSWNTPVDCKGAVEKYPRFICMTFAGPVNNACCKECAIRNITTGICSDLPGKCEEGLDKHKCHGNHQLYNDCPLACGLCTSEDCARMSCLNGGSKTYRCTCLCPKGFQGENCEIKNCIDDSCAPCLNSGTRLHNGTCLCKPDNFGKMCECSHDKDRKVSVSIRVDKYSWRMYNCDRMKRTFPKFTCLRKRHYCCDACRDEEKRLICQDDAFYCPSTSIEECQYTGVANMCPFKCGLCTKEDCPGVRCYNGGTLNKDCSCSCTANWTGTICDKDAHLCEGEDVLSATYCEEMTSLSNWDAFCNTDHRLKCCASCRAAKELCVDDPDHCGPGKTFSQEWLCSNYPVGIYLGIRQKCRKMCNWCRDSEGRLLRGNDDQ